MNQPQQQNDHQRPRGDQQQNKRNNREKYFDRISKTPSVSILIHSPYIHMCVNALKVLDQQIMAAGERLASSAITPEQMREFEGRVLDVNAYIKDQARTIDKTIGRIPGRPQRPGKNRDTLGLAKNGGGTQQQNGNGAQAPVAAAPAIAAPATAAAVAPAAPAASAKADTKPPVAKATRTLRSSGGKG